MLVHLEYFYDGQSQQHYKLVHITRPSILRGVALPPPNRRAVGRFSRYVSKRTDNVESARFGPGSCSGSTRDTEFQNSHGVQNRSTFKHESVPKKSSF